MAESRSLSGRMVGAALLSSDTFEEVEHDESATGQAAIVVVLAAVAQAIGNSGEGLFAAAFAALAAVVGWGVWSGVTYFIGTRGFDGRATWGEVLRAVGFAYAPGILAILGIIPLMGLFLWVLPFWFLIAAFIGLRQALDISTFKTFLTVLLGFIPYVILNALARLFIPGI